MLTLYMNAGLYFFCLQFLLISATVLFFLGLSYFAYDTDIFDGTHLYYFIASVVVFFLIGLVVLLNISPFHKLSKRRLANHLNSMDNEKEKERFKEKVKRSKNIET